jgi:hypothetical protein
VESPLLKNCLNILQKKEKKIVEANCFPLIYLGQYLSELNLPPLEISEIKSECFVFDKGLEPSFKVLTDNILCSLRYLLYSQRELDLVATWAEKLMRFCEVRYRTLEKRSLDKCKSKIAAKLHMFHLASFLMDYSIATNDLRFFNTVLKLTDLKWLTNKGLLTKHLSGDNNEFNAALFEFRVLLSIEYTFNRFSKEKING